MELININFYKLNNKKLLIFKILSGYWSYKEGVKHKWFNDSDSFNAGCITGVIFGGGLLLIFLTNFWIKKKIFEAFYRIHIILTIFFIVLCVIHPS